MTRHDAPQPDTQPHASPTSRDAYSPDEVAERLGLSRRSVDRAIRRGDLRAVRIGGLVRIPVAEIDRLLGTAAA